MKWVFVFAATLVVVAGKPSISPLEIEEKDTGSVDSSEQSVLSEATHPEQALGSEILASDEHLSYSELAALKLELSSPVSVELLDHTTSPTALPEPQFTTVTSSEEWTSSQPVVENLKPANEVVHDKFITISYIKHQKEGKPETTIVIDTNNPEYAKKQPQIIVILNKK